MFRQISEGFRSLILRGLRKVLLVIAHELGAVQVVLLNKNLVTFVDVFGHHQ